MTTGASYEVCESADGIQCSGSTDHISKTPLTIPSDPLPSYLAHLHYYNVSLVSWFRSGCASKGHLKIKPNILP